MNKFEPFKVINQTIDSIEARESLEMPSQRWRGSGGLGKCDGGIGVQSGDWGGVEDCNQDVK